MDLNVRKTIEHLIEPVYKAQDRLEADCMTTLVNRIDTLQNRIKQLEDDIYDNQTREDKLVKIDKRIRDEEVLRKTDFMNIETTVNQLKSQLNGLEGVEANVNIKIEKTEQMNVDIRKYLDQCIIATQQQMVTIRQ